MFSAAASNLFVACQTDDDLPYVLKYAGENCLMIGSDYGHADNASELLALAKLKGQRRNRSEGDRQDSLPQSREVLWAGWGLGDVFVIGEA